MKEGEDGYVTMFSGKGGVGKTTCAAATALHHARQGQSSLVISTDPTPSLSHIFGVNGREKPAVVSERLFLAELGMDEVKEMWHRKFGREVYQVFSSFVSVSYPEFVDFITSILPGLKDEFIVDYIRELAAGKRYQRIIWDTAPLGQTMGLLGTPAMLSQHLKPAPRIYSRLKLGTGTRRSVFDIIEGWAEISNADVAFLRTGVRFVLVTIPEALAFEQIGGVVREFDRYGFEIKQLIINNVIRDISSDFLRIKAEQQQKYLDLLHEGYHHLPIVEIPMLPREIKGIERLKDIEKSLYG